MKGLMLKCFYENLCGLLIGSLTYGLDDVYLVLVLLAISAESLEWLHNSQDRVKGLFPSYSDKVNLDCYMAVRHVV